MKNLPALCLIILCAGCKKQDSISPDQITFSLNDSAEAVCKMQIRPDFDYIGTSSCELNVDRTGTFKAGQSAEIAFFEEYNCDLTTGQIPYLTKYFRLVIIYYKTPGESIAYSYDKGTYWPDTTATTPGDLLLNITERSSHRLRGTISGTIYRTNVGQNLIQAKLYSIFDLSMPLAK